MKYYFSVKIETLSIIQEKVFALIAETDLSATNLFYPANNLELFLGIPELRAALDNLGWTEYVDSFAIHILQPHDRIALHTDTGDFDYSLNIPIKNCEKTFVNFYSSSSPPVDATHDKVTYKGYDAKKCSIVTSLELKTPYVINVKEIHNVVSLNKLPRITLLIRLGKNIDLPHMTN